MEGKYLESILVLPIASLAYQVGCDVVVLLDDLLILVEQTDVDQRHVQVDCHVVGQRLLKTVLEGLQAVLLLSDLEQQLGL